MRELRHLPAERRERGERGGRIELRAERGTPGSPRAVLASAAANSSVTSSSHRAATLLTASPPSTAAIAGWDCSAIASSAAMIAFLPSAGVLE